MTQKHLLATIQAPPCTLSYTISSMNPKGIRHRVERTKNKHSRAVFRDDTIVIRLAKNLSKTEEKEHIHDLLRKMTQYVLEEEQKTTINPFKTILSEGQSQTVTLANGKKYSFTLEPGNKTAARRTTRGWRITVGPRTRRSGLHRLLWSLLAREEQPHIAKLVQEINNETFGVHITSVRFKFATSQWGSCSPKGIIMLNAAMLFVPTVALKYVIVHELAHRRRADHSPTYWKWVQWAMPGYKRARGQLGEYRLPSL